MAEQDFEKLLAIIRQLNAELGLVEGNVARFQQQFSKTGAEDFNRALANQKLVAQQLREELTRVQEAYNKLSGSAKANTNTYIPGGAPGGKGSSSGIGGSTARFGANVATFPVGAGDKAKIEEEKLLQTLRGRVQSEIKYKQALDQATALGFKITDLRKSVRRGTAGVEQLQFERYDQGGSQQRFDTFVSPGGRATPGISNQFRTFGQGIVRDIGELTKWSIALAAVYGPLKKLQELTQIMIDNQTRLAEATITVNSSFLSQGQIFDNAADSANKAGEEISGVIDAFTQAYRAAGGGGTQVERFATANELLADSLTLSKLSTLDQASAIDTLAAALRQTERGLGNGTELLDKWVRVTKVANVDLTTLATGFAVVGDAAEAAGIDADKLNGIIAAIAETGISSGKETANIARSLVSGFQSDQARKELENLGIAVEDTTGQMRPFLDIMKEIYNLRQSGAIDDTQFSKLTLALGGGTRRQAAYSSFIENFDRVFSIAEESTKASGDAEAALAKQLDTVQTSITRLGNSFESLAQTMGTEGGFLGIMSSSVDLLTAFIKGVDGLTGAFGKATPMIMAFIAASTALKYRGQGGISTVLGNFGQSLQPSPMDLERQALGVQLSGATRTRQFLGTNVFGSNAASAGAQGLLTSIIPAYLNATNKQDRFGGLKAGADVVGGITGGIVGSLTGPQGTIIGASIGTAIADAFITKTVAYETNLFGYANKPQLGENFRVDTSKDPEAALKQAEVSLYKSLGGGNEAIGRFLAGSDQELADALVEKLNEAIKSGDPKKISRALNELAPTGRKAETELNRLGISKQLIQEAISGGKPIEFNKESVAYNKASEDARREFDKALADYNATQQTTADVATPFKALVEENKRLFGPLLDSIQESTKKDISNQRLQGDLKGSEYARQLTAVGGFDTKALQYYSALGDEFVNINKDVTDANGAMQAFAEILVKGSADAVPEITSIVSEIEQLVNLLADPALHKDALEAFGGADAAKERLAELRKTGASLLTDVYNQTRLSNLKIPEVQGDINKPLTSDDLQKVKVQAIKMQQDFYKGYLDFSDSQYESITESFDEWAQIIQDSGDAFFEKIEGIDPQFFQQAMAKLLEENKLKSQQANPFGIQQLDITSAQGAGLQGKIDYFSQYLQKNFPQYQQKPEEFGVIFSDYVTDVLHGDNLAVKLALEKLVDLNQKQLDGMYNIPEGATFWVPLTAAYYRPQNEGTGLGGGTGLDSTAVDSNTSATDQNTRALEQLREHLLRENRNTYEEGTKGEKKERLQDRLVDRFRGTEVGKGNTPNPLTPALLERQYAMRGRGYETPGSEARPSGFVEELKAALAQFALQFTKNGLGVGQGIGAGGTAGSGYNQQQGIKAGRDMNNMAPPVTAKLDFRIDSTTTLMVDGRVLASVITPYLASDLLRLEASQGTITKRYVI